MHVKGRGINSVINMTQRSFVTFYGQSYRPMTL